MVNKSALILKEETPDFDANSSQESDSVNSVANIKEVENGRHSDHKMDTLISGDDQRLVSKYDRLVNSDPNTRSNFIFHFSKFIEKC